MTQKQANQAPPPARLSERVFRKYELAIAKAVDTFPLPVIIKTSVPNSTACQVRAAMKSFNEYNWPSKIDCATFAKLYDLNELICREHEGQVAIGGREESKLNKQSPPESCSFFEQNQGEEFKIELEYYQTQDRMVALLLLVRLAGERALCKPVRLVNLTESQAEKLTGLADILLEQDKTKTNEWILS